MNQSTIQFRISNRQMLCLLVIVLLALSGSTVYGQETEEYFRTNCMSCHTIGGGKLTGPDLKDVAQRKDREWLIAFLLDPQAVINSGDPYAKQLLDEARGAIMPGFPTMTKKRAGQLLDLIEEESKLETSQFKGVQVSDRPFTAADVENGRNFFLGYTRLENMGAPCISCHAVNGISGLGGGTLAPDLTTVYERYEGRKTLASWLSAPATPTMQSVFKTHPLTPDEVLALTAFFEHTLQRNPDDPSTARLNFLLFSVGAVVLILGIFDVIWNKRFRSVRRALVTKVGNEIRSRAKEAGAQHQSKA